MSAHRQTNCVAPVTVNALEKMVESLQSGRKRILGPSEIRPLSSEYLAGGCARDRFELALVSVSGATVQGVARMSSTFVSSTDAGGFHLSAIVALQMASQLGIVHGHALKGSTEKESEVWMGEVSFKFRRPLRDPHHIEIRLIARNVFRSRSQRIGIDYLMDMGNGAFVGEFKLYFE